MAMEFGLKGFGRLRFAHRGFRAFGIEPLRVSPVPASIPLSRGGMSKTLRGTATEAIAFGQHVLCRGWDCSPADPSVANGIARSLPSFTRRTTYKKGDFVLADRIEGVGERDVHALAKMPIMDPVRLNLPAGKLTEAEYQERLDLQFKSAGIARR